MDLSILTDAAARAGLLTLTALAVALPYRAGLWNIGGEGQYHVGAVAGTGAALAVSAPPFLLLLIAFGASMLAAAGYAGIAAWLKLRFRANEILVTVMLSFVGVILLKWAVHGPLRDPEGFGFPVSPYLPEAVWLPSQNGLHVGILVALGLAIGLGALIRYTPLLMTLRAVRQGRTAAAYHETSFSGVVLGTFLGAGALAGLAGMTQIAAVQHRLYDSISADFGYLGIPIALLAQGRPWWIPPTALGFALLMIGASNAGLPNGLAGAIVAAAVLLKLAFDRGPRR